MKPVRKNTVWCRARESAGPQVARAGVLTIDLSGARPRATKTDSAHVTGLQGQQPAGKNAQGLGDTCELSRQGPRRLGHVPGASVKSQSHPSLAGRLGTSSSVSQEEPRVLVSLSLLPSPQEGATDTERLEEDPNS